MNPTAPERSSEFRAVEGGGERHNGTVLLVEAYTAIWLILFGIVFVTFRKQRRLEARLELLETAIRKARKESS